MCSAWLLVFSELMTIQKIGKPSSTPTAMRMACLGRLLATRAALLLFAGIIDPPRRRFEQHNHYQRAHHEQEERHGRGVPELQELEGLFVQVLYVKPCGGAWPSYVLAFYDLSLCEVRDACYEL